MSLHLPAVLLEASMLIGTSLSVAAPGCNSWDLNGLHEIVQGNGAQIVLNLRQHGEQLSGTAGWTERHPGPEPVATGHGGGVNGTFDGTRFNVQIAWSNGSLGVYTGDIDATGRLRGSTHDRRHPGTKVAWHSTTRVTCVPPAAPAKAPVARRIGRGTPSRPADPRASTADISLPSVGANAGSAMGGQAAICKSGFVWREARPNDLVCVTPASRAQVYRENSTAPERWNPGGPYGPATCAQGFVWREAFQGDVTCVTPQRRADVREENALSASRRLHE